MQISSVTRLFHNIPCGAVKRSAATMSCLWFLCCRVHEDSDTDSERKEEQQSEKKKKGKKKRSGRKWKMQWKKARKNNKNKDEEEEEKRSQTIQQPAKLEEEADVVDLPVGLVSGSLKSISPETPENTAPPQQQNLTEETDETKKRLMNTLLDEVEAQMEQLLKTETVMMIGEPLEKHLDHPVSTNDDAAKAIRELLEVLFADALMASVQPLKNEMITKKAAEAEAEAIDAFMSISVEDNEKEHLEEPLDNLVSITDDKTGVISELLEIQLEYPASVQPLCK
ncbi:calponin homology domain-containing protein DDB_G0272472-like [Colossoma macropomum]|uniref:calponin homology domain-containing protein DDB_G0272472-like n=1 Tax=Colossoma macropomum TaxID=42526 RepID=UPI001864DD49|nr:calponin homology domain-containing protein DDB_G0272472-like [Colossoma macropomum]XP_036417249.1 calponin homology domain-containing protein DDB_G0272472-like [Colossoma macropomum]